MVGRTEWKRELIATVVPETDWTYPKRFYAEDTINLTFTLSFKIRPGGDRRLTSKTEAIAWLQGLLDAKDNGGGVTETV